MMICDRDFGTAFFEPAGGGRSSPVSAPLLVLRLGTDRSDEVPASKRGRVIRIPARHARHTQEVHREERQVDANERHSEMRLPPELWILMAGHFADPVIETGKDCENGAKRQDVVEVRNCEIRIVQHLVDARVGEHDTRDASDREHENEADTP
jgi:hypothetical protein